MTIIRALQYFFLIGNSPGRSHLSAEAVCEALAQLIRDGHIQERALTEHQIKRWLSLEKRKKNPRPSWIIEDDPSCIWNFTASVATPIIDESSSSPAIPLEDSENDDSQELTGDPPQALRSPDLNISSRTTANAYQTMPSSSSEVPTQHLNTRELLMRWFTSRQRQEAHQTP